MTTDSGYRAAKESVNEWSRVVGISLRPWSGRSPLSLIIRGAIQLVVSAFVISFMIGLRAEAKNSPEAAAVLGTFLLIMIITFAGFILMALAQLVMGVLDLFPRQTVHGVVLSLEERKMGDVLPYFLQRLIFERNSNSLDRRKRRTELVLRTDKGVRQWTVRNSRARRELQVGRAVAITASPLLGYVANVEVIQP